MITIFAIFAILITLVASELYLLFTEYRAAAKVKNRSYTSR